MIPKIIHFCWFGDKKMPRQYATYIKGWKKKMPDYDFVIWNDNNIDEFLDCDFAIRAKMDKRYAFLSDYVRIKALYRYGGFYLDTDVQVLRSFDSICPSSLVFGLESEHIVSTAFIASSQYNHFLEQVICFYRDIDVDLPDFKFERFVNTILLSNMLVDAFKLNEVTTLRIPELEIKDVDAFSCVDIYTNRTTITDNTFCIHHFSGSWLPRNTRIWNGVKKIIKRLLPVTLVTKIQNKNKHDF